MLETVLYSTFKLFTACNSKVNSKHFQTVSVRKLVLYSTIPSEIINKTQYYNFLLVKS